MIAKTLTDLGQARSSFGLAKLARTLDKRRSMHRLNVLFCAALLTACVGEDDYGASDEQHLTQTFSSGQCTAAPCNVEFQVCTVEPRDLTFDFYWAGKKGYATQSVGEADFVEEHDPNFPACVYVVQQIPVKGQFHWNVTVEDGYALATGDWALCSPDVLGNEDISSAIELGMVSSDEDESDGPLKVSGFMATEESVDWWAVDIEDPWDLSNPRLRLDLDIEEHVDMAVYYRCNKGSNTALQMVAAVEGRNVWYEVQKLGGTFVDIDLACPGTSNDGGTLYVGFFPATSSKESACFGRAYEGWVRDRWW